MEKSINQINLNINAVNQTIGANIDTNTQSLGLMTERLEDLEKNQKNQEAEKK